MKRDITLKILDIKSIRSLTLILGKLHIEPCFVRYSLPKYHLDPVGGHIVKIPVISERYGLGLKETKDLVERIYNYSTN